MLPALIASDLFRVGTKQIAGCDVGPIILCDQAFPLDTHLMKPYPYSTAVHGKQQAFNSCLSGARRVVENAFGRMKARYRIVHKGLECCIENANKIVRTCVVLHNICEDMRDRCCAHWYDGMADDDEARPQPDRMTKKASASGGQVREALAEHILRLKSP